MYSIHGEQFISGFLGLHNVDRALISEHPKFNVWYYYLLIVPLSLLPWTPVIVYHLKDLNWKDDFDLLGIIWFIVIVLFYSLVATKYLTYTLPAIIPCIIWAAVKICELVTDKDPGTPWHRDFRCRRRLRQGCFLRRRQEGERRRRE